MILKFVRIAVFLFYVKIDIGVLKACGAEFRIRRVK